VFIYIFGADGVLFQFLYNKHTLIVTKKVLSIIFTVTATIFYLLLFRFGREESLLKRIQRQNADVNKKHRFVVIVYFIQCAYIMTVLPLLTYFELTTDTVPVGTSMNTINLHI
jgi:hypothetical protein